jgi:hypothetical protein
VELERWIPATQTATAAPRKIRTSGARPRPENTRQFLSEHDPHTAVDPTPSEIRKRVDARDFGLSRRPCIHLACSRVQPWADHFVARRSGRRPSRLAAGSSGERRPGARPAHTPCGWNSWCSAAAVSLSDPRLPSSAIGCRSRCCRLDVDQDRRRRTMDARSSATEDLICGSSTKLRVLLGSRRRRGRPARREAVPGERHGR